MQQLLQNMSHAATAVFSIALMLIAGFAFTRVTKRLRLPNVTAYILAGILLGPYVLNIVPQTFVDNSDFLPDVALAFVAFGAGEYLRIASLKKDGGKILLLTFIESLFTTVLVYAGCKFILGLPFAFSMILAALASVTASTSTLMTIRQTEARGPFVETLLEVIALETLVSLVGYNIAVSVAASSLGGSAVSAWDVFRPLLVNCAVLVIGAVFGWLLKLLMPKRRSQDNRLIISISVLFAFCGLCALLDVSPLLGCMSMGTVYRNVTDDDKLFKQLGYFTPPILLIFFVRSGVNFRLDALFGTAGGIGGVPLILIAVIYVLLRLVGKYFGAFLGAFATKHPAGVRRYLGLALLPHGSVAIGLAALGARVLGGEIGSSLETLVCAAAILYELIGPAAAKFALFRSHAYGVPQEVPTEVTPPKNEVERILEQIETIKKELPEHEDPYYENEAAFTEAAEEHRAAMPQGPRFRRGRGRR